MFKKSSLSVLGIISIVLCSSTFYGCKSKAERDAEKAEQRQKKQDAEKAAEAQIDLSQQTALYEGLAGSYAGNYFDDADQQLLITLDLRVENKKPEYAPNRKEREGDLLSQRGALSLIADVTQSYVSPYYTWTDPMTKKKKTEKSRVKQIQRCQPVSVKPDFALGKIRVLCTMDGTARSFEFGFVESKEQFGSNVPTREEFDEENARMGSLLTRNQIRNIDAMNVFIKSNDLETLGWLQRN